MPSTSTTKKMGKTWIKPINSTQFNNYSIDGHTLHLRSEEGYNKTGFRDNLCPFQGIFHNFFPDEAFHFWKLFESCLFQLNQ
jgi:hypothetical protein